MFRKAIALALVGLAGAAAGLFVCGAAAQEMMLEPWGDAALFPGEMMDEPMLGPERPVVGTMPDGSLVPQPSPDRHTLVYPVFLDDLDGDGLLDGCYGWGRPAYVGVSASGMFLAPDTPRQTIFFDPATELDLRTTDATLGYEPAARLAVQVALGPLGVGEAIYFGVDGWGAQARLTDGDFTQNGLLGFAADDVTDLRLVTTAELQSFESNLRLYDAPAGWGVLVGARYIEEREFLRITDRFLNRMGAAGIDTFTFATDNQMAGIQVGMDMALEEGPWRLDARLKVAAFANDNRRRGEAIVPGVGTGFASFDVRDTRSAFLGEFNITGAYYVLPTVALTLGAQLMLFEGVAVASEQFDGPNASSNPVFNGGLVGIEVYR
jgi:hypothetical protein